MACILLLLNSCLELARVTGKDWEKGDWNAWFIPGFTKTSGDSWIHHQPLLMMAGVGSGW